MVEPVNRRDVGRDRFGPLIGEFEEEHPDAARQLGGGAGALPVQDGIGGGIAAFDLGDRVRPQGYPLKPAVHLGHVRDTKAQAGEHALLVVEQRAHAVGGDAEAARRHQLDRHVLEREQHPVGALARILPGRRASEQGLIGRLRRTDIPDQNDDVIEAGDHVPSSATGRNRNAREAVGSARSARPATVVFRPSADLKRLSP
ncbi:hypothetical protein A5906_35440 [Bradyrhizobium sacchari]|nr:hypothetical protein A5906_35440 [Bradyrhizobium sacchari]